MKNFDNIIAKKENGSTINIVDHTKMVLHVAMELSKNFHFNESKYGKAYNDMFRTILSTSCILHDIGKFSKEFQNIITKNKEDKDFEKHNLISWAFSMKYLFVDSNDIYYSNISKSILFHHYFNTGKDGEKLTVNTILKKQEKTINDMMEFYGLMSEYSNKLYGVYNLPLKENVGVIKDIKLLDQTIFDEVEDINNNESWRETSIAAAMSKLASGLLIYADRIVSKNVNNGSEYLNNNTDFIRKEYENFQTVNKEINPDFSKYDTDRLEKQKNLIDKITSDNVRTHIIPASAGSGKTLMGLMYFINTKHKLLWNVPTTNLAESAYHSIIEELNKLNLNHVTVGLMYNGKLQKTSGGSGNYEDYDIIVSVVDTFLSYHHKNDMRTYLINAYDRDVIFDEYHEFITDQPLFALFNQIMYTRVNMSNSKTILLSATSKDFKRYWGANNDNIRTWNNAIDIFGAETPVHVKFIKGQVPVSCDSISFIGTVNDSQRVFRDNGENGILVHSYFLDEDKQKIYNKIFELYGKSNKGDETKVPIITSVMLGVGWDISARTINDVVLSPDDTIQRLGRASRFREYNYINYNICDLPSMGSFNKLVSNNYVTSLNNAWKNILREYDGKTITKGEFYELYDNFYRDHRKEYSNYIDKLYNSSCSSLTAMKLKRGTINGSTIYISSDMTYRGVSDNFFVTVKKDNDYIHPMVARESFFYSPYSSCREDESSENNKERYEFMTSGKFNFPNKNVLSRKYRIAIKNEASVEKCMKMAKNSENPLLLCDFVYDELGLHHKNSTL